MIRQIQVTEVVLKLGTPHNRSVFVDFIRQGEDVLYKLITTKFLKLRTATQSQSVRETPSRVQSILQIVLIVGRTHTDTAAETVVRVLVRIIEPKSAKFVRRLEEVEVDVK